MGHTTSSLDTEGVLEGFVSICRVCWSVRVSASWPVCVLERRLACPDKLLQNMTRADSLRDMLRKEIVDYISVLAA